MDRPTFGYEVIGRCRPGETLGNLPDYLRRYLVDARMERVLVRVLTPGGRGDHHAKGDVTILELPR